MTVGSACRGPQDAFVPQPVTVSLTANPATASEGDPVTLTVASTNATSVTIDNGVGSVAANGTVTVRPTATTTYTATATGASGTATSRATVTVNPIQLAATLSASPQNIVSGQSTTLTWTTTGATTVTIDNGVGTVAATGNANVSPTANTTYTLTATAASGRSTTVQAAVNVLPPGSALINLEVSPASITSGQIAVLKWTSANVPEIRIDAGAGNQAFAKPGKNGIGVFLTPSGQVTVSPSANTTYTAVGYNNAGQEIARASVTLAATQDTTKLKANVKHIIYMLQENRSFDMHYGKLNEYRASQGLPQDVDGLPAGASQVAKDGTTITAYKFKSACLENLTPDWMETHKAYNLGDADSDRPKLNGFVDNASGMADFSGRVVANDGRRLNAEPLMGSATLVHTGSPSASPTESTIYYLFTESFGFPKRWVRVLVDPDGPNRPGQPLPANPPSFVQDPTITFTVDTDPTDAVPAGETITINKGESITLSWNAPPPATPPAPPLTATVKINRWYDQYGKRAMGYHDAEHLPWHYFMAAQFATSDRFFAPHPGNSPANRAYSWSATSNGRAHDPGTITVPSIFHRLLEKGVSWKVYYSLESDGIPHSVFMRYPDLVANHRGKLVKIDDPVNGYFEDLRRGTLPQVAFIDEASGLDEHPGGTVGSVNSGNHVQQGALYLAGIVNALMASTSWPDSVFLMTFDEFGGQYDHVIPPDAVHPDGVAPCANPNHPADPTGRCDLDPKDVIAAPDADFTRTSFRVPLLVVSPWTRKNYVSHTTADFTAFLKFIETRFDLAPLTERDKVQIDMLEFFDFDTKPWATPPANIPAQPTNLSCNYTQLD